MRFTLDVGFLTRTARRCASPAVRPWRLARAPRGTRFVLELAGGQAAACGLVQGAVRTRAPGRPLAPSTRRSVARPSTRLRTPSPARPFASFTSSAGDAGGRAGAQHLGTQDLGHELELGAGVDERRAHRVEALASAAAAPSRRATALHAASAVIAARNCDRCGPGRRCADRAAPHGAGLRASAGEPLEPPQARDEAAGEAVDLPRPLAAPPGSPAPAGLRRCDRVVVGDRPPQPAQERYSEHEQPAAQRAGAAAAVSAPGASAAGPGGRRLGRRHPRLGHGRRIGVRASGSRPGRRRSTSRLGPGAGRVRRAHRERVARAVLEAGHGERALRAVRRLAARERRSRCRSRPSRTGEGEKVTVPCLSPPLGGHGRSAASARRAASRRSTRPRPARARRRSRP